MIRTIGKTCFAAAYTLTHAARRLAPTAERTTPAPFIVCYHRVVENFARSRKNAIPSMLTSTAMLERHIDWLAKRFSIVSLDEIGEHLESRQPFQKPAAAITFDDGYSDVFHHAYPLLKRKGIPAAVFVVTGLVDTGRPQIFDRLYLLLLLLHSQGKPLVQTVAQALGSLGLNPESLKRLDSIEDDPFRVMTVLLNTLPKQCVEQMIGALERIISFDRQTLEEFAPLTWDMIETMHRDGITIGSHTKSHTLLTSESLDMARRELAESKRMLETKLQSAVRHFAYPDGRFNSSVVQAVNSTGYRFGYSICSRRDGNHPLLTIPRKVLWERSCLNALGRFSSSIMNCQVNWVFDRKDRCGHDHSTIQAEEHDPSTIHAEEMNGTIN